MIQKSKFFDQLLILSLQRGSNDFNKNFKRVDSQKTIPEKNVVVKLGVSDVK